MSDPRPCPFCGYPKARLIGKVELRQRKNGELTATEYDYFGGVDDVRMLDFRYAFYARCNKCGARGPVRRTPWHVRTQDEADNWTRDAKYFGYEQSSEYSQPARDAATDAWNRRDACGSTSDGYRTFEGAGR